MNKVTSYFKNVNKSIAYASVDIATSKLIPEVRDFVDTNQELFKATYSAIRHTRKSIRYGKKMAQQSQIYKDINIGIDNIFEDIKTGNFYNKSRAQASMDLAGENMAGGFGDFDDMGDLDDFDFNFDDDDGSLDSFQDKPAPATQGDAIVAESVVKSSNLSAQLISKTVANTSNNIIKANIASNNLMMAQNMELVAGIRTSIAGVHESINKILKFNVETVVSHMNTQSQFFNDSMNIMKESNAYLKEIAEIQRNIYKRELDKEKIKDAYSNVYSGGGNVDLVEYFKAIGKNVKNLDKSGILTALLADQGGSSMLSQFLSNPLGEITKSVIQQFIPSSFAKSVASFSKSLGNLFPAFIAKMNKWKNDEFGIRGFLGSLFGINTDRKNSVDTSKYTKGAVPFDGITRKAIVDVIPEHLSKIESLLSGSAQRTYDFHTGKWISTKDIKKKYDDDYKYLVEDSFMEIRDDIKQFVYEIEKSNKLSAEKKKSLEDDIYKIMETTFKQGGHFSPEELKNSGEFNNPDIMEALLSAMAVDKNFSLSKLTSVSGRTFDNVRKWSQKLRDYESGGDSIIRKLFDDSNNNSHLKFHDKYTNEVVGNKAGFNLLNIKDSSGMNVLDYLKNILVNVSYIREYGGRRRGNNTRQKDFKSYSDNFNTEYIPESIKKLMKEEKEQEEYYNKYHEETAAQAKVDIDDVIINAASSLRRNKFSDLDEEVFSGFGTRYKDKNKYQKELDNIPGDTFLQKFMNAENSKQKYALILGSLSDIAKKPATIITGMIQSAENSIYNFLFKAETDEYDEELGKKITGFFPAMLYKMKAKWAELTTSLDEKFITPLVKKYGLDEKWDKLKEKVKNSKPMDMIREFGGRVRTSLGSDLKSVGRYAASVADPIRYDRNIAESRIQGIRRRLERTNESELESLKGILSNLSDEELQLIKREASPRLLNMIEKAGFAKGTNGKEVEVTQSGPIYVSEGERVKVTRGSSGISEDRQNELRLALRDLESRFVNGRSQYTRSALARVRNIRSNADRVNSTRVSDTFNSATAALSGELRSFVGRVYNLGDTPEEQEKSIKKERGKLIKTVGDILTDMKGEGAGTVSKAIIGGGLGLLTGVAAGPLIGAGVGAAVSLGKNSKTINEFLFGKNRKYNDDGTLESKEGGIISKDIQNAFKKYLPDTGKGALLGTIGSLILPFGPLAGAAIGAGIGLAKNSSTLNEMLFGEEEGLINKDRKEKLKKYLPKAAIGAAAGMFLGPFGLLGNAAVGAGVGLLTGTEEFRDIIFGEKDEHGKRIGGITGTLKEHFVDPVVEFGRNFKDDFFGFIKESMIDPLNEAITPIAEGIAFQTKRIVFGIPKMFAQLGKDYIAVPILNKLNDKVIDPITKGIKGLFGGLLAKAKGIVSLPFRAIGRAGKQARRHQIKQGRDVVGKSAADRLKFAREEGIGDYRYEGFDSKLAENADNEEWLEELTARTGMLAHGSDYFEKEVKKARRELSRVVSDYYKLGWFSKDKKSYKRIRQYIHDNDIEAAIEELTNIQKSRTTGGPLGNEAGSAIANFNRANKAYQIARDRRDKFGEINESDNAAWMEENFGPNWRSMKSDRLFAYASRELKNSTGRSVTKSDILSDPRNIITKGESEIKKTLDDIYALLSGRKYKFNNREDEAEYNRRAESGRQTATNVINSNKLKIKTSLSDKGFNVKQNKTIDLLYEYPLIYELLLTVGEKGIHYDDDTIQKLCGLKLSKKDIKLIEKYPYVAFANPRDIKKNLNYKRNNYATISMNSLFGAKHIRNNNLSDMNMIQKANNEFDISKIKNDDKGTYISTNYGPRRYVVDDKGKYTIDTSDAETKESLEREKQDNQYKESFFGTVSSLKDSVFGLFSRNKEKDEEEKKEPWYKKLFNADLGDFGGKLKFGALLLGGFAAIGAVKNLIESNSIAAEIASSISNAISPKIKTIGDWITNQGEYSAQDKGMSGFLDKYVFPNLFSGMNVFFGNILPAVITAFIKNIPTMVSAGIRGVGELFGYKNNKHQYDANVSVSDSNVSTTTSTGSSLPWLNKVSSDSINTATSISNMQATVGSNGDINVNTSNVYAQTNGNSTANNLIAQNSTSTGNVAPSDAMTNVNNPNEPVEMEGIGPIYKKEKGKLVPITAGEFGKITEFWNETGKGHWVLDKDSGQFIADSGTSKDKSFPAAVGYAALKSALTHKTPGIFSDKSKSIFKGIDKVLGETPIIGKSYKLFSLPIKGAATIADRATDIGHNAGLSFKNAFDAEKNKGTYEKSTFSRISEWAKNKKGSTPDKPGPSIGNAWKKYDGDLLTKAKNFIKSGLEKIFGNSTVKKFVTDAVKESSGAKAIKALDSTVTNAIKSSIDNIMKGIMKKLPTAGAKVISKIAGGAATAGVLTAIFIGQDFLGGVDKAESILGIKEPTALQTFIAGLVNVIAKELLFGLIDTPTLVSWMINWILPVFKVDTSKLNEQRAEVTSEVIAYNKANGENLTEKEYLERNYSISGKFKNWKNKTWNNIKDWGSNAWDNTKKWGSNAWDNTKKFGSSIFTGIKNTGKNLKDKITQFGDSRAVQFAKSTGQKLKEGVSGIAEGIGNTFSKVTDFGEYGVIVLKDVLRDAISGKNVTTEGIKLDKDDPDYDTKKTLYNIIKIVTYLPAAQIKIARTIYDKFISPIVKGTVEIGSSIGKNTKNLFKQSWDGHFIQAMMDPGIDTGNPATNILSKTITNGLIKPSLAPIGLLTTAAGAIVRNANSIIDGFKTIGSSIVTSVKNRFKDAWAGDVKGIFESDNPKTGNKLVDNTAGIINSMTTIATALPAFGTSAVGAIVRNSDSIISGFKTIGSSVVSSTTNRFKNAWNGNIKEVFKNDNPRTGNKLVDNTAKVINSMTAIGTALPTFSASVIGAGVRAIDKVIDGIKKIKPSGADTKILKDANNGDIKIWDSEYWKISEAPDGGITGALYKFNAYLQKVLNVPSALLGLINPANWDIAEGISDGAQKFANWLGIKNEYEYNYQEPTGSGTGKYKSGKGTGFVSQVDPKYANKTFNTSKDTEHQTLGDSGCAPATAANVINFYAGEGAVMENASKAALKYKGKNTGVTPDYFENYLEGKGIKTYTTRNKNEITGSIKSGRPTVLLGRNSNKKANTPYGTTNSHYVLATGFDGRGNVIIQDPESRKPNRLYPVKDVINNSQLGVVTGRGNIFSEFRKSALSYYDDKLLNLFGISKEEEQVNIDTSAINLNNTTYTTIPSSMNGSAAEVVRIARSQIGYKGGPGKSAKYKTEPQDSGGWCAYFVRWCYRQAGLGHLYCGGKRTGNPKKVENYYKERNLLVDIDSAQPGDIVTFYRDSHHTGLMEKNNGDGTFYCIEGNTGGGNGEVKRLKRKKSDIHSVARPFLAAKGSDVRNSSKNIVSLSGRGTQFENAASAALKYKDINSGVTPDYFEDYLGRSGINTHSTTDKAEMLSNIRDGRPTILLGHDPSNRSNTPYGSSSSHYVLATGMDGNGNVIVQDPESRQPDSIYPADQLLAQSQLGMVTSKSSGRGSRRITKRSGRGTKFSRIKNKINSKLTAGRGLSKTEIEKRVWSALRGAGYNEIQVAGVMGNIKHESGFNPSIVERGSGIGFGLCQWSYGRRTNIEKYARSIGKSPNNLDVQITFLLAEMNPKGGANGYAKYQFTKSSSRYDGKVYSKDSFKNAKDIETATRAFCFCFERPSYNPNVNHISSRIKSAKSYYEKYTGTSASTVSIGTDSVDTSTSTNTSNTLYGLLGEAVTSYYDKKLLNLFGFNETQPQTTTTTPTTTENGTMTEFSGATGSAAAVVQLALKQEGNRGSKYQSYCGIGGLAWCAAFVCWVFNKAGCGKLFYGGKKSAYCPTILSYHRKKGQVVNKTQGQPGDMIFFDYEPNGSPNHIGIIVSRTKTGYNTIEGNYSNKVTRVKRKLSEVMAIVRPKWSGSGSGKNKAIGTITNVSSSGRGSGRLKTNTIAAINRYSISGRGTMPNVKDERMMLQDEHSADAARNRNISNSNNTFSNKLLSGSGRSYKYIEHKSTFKQSSISGKGTGFGLPSLSSTTRSVSSIPYSNSGNYSYGTNTGTSSTDRLLSTIIEVLTIIASNSEKLSEIVSLLSKALDLNLSKDDISKLSSNNAQIKNKIANALKVQGSHNGMGSSSMNATTESLAAAMYSIASA